MEFSSDELQTIFRAIDFYKKSIKFNLSNVKLIKNIKLRKEFEKNIDLYKQDLFNIDSIEKYIK